MTISTTSSVTVAQGNNETVTFDFPFVVDSADDLTVIYTSATGAVTTLTPSQFTAYLNPPATGSLHSVGGTITYPISGSPIPPGASLQIQRSVQYTQETQLTDQGDFNPQVIELALDELEMQIQQILGRTGAYRGTWLTGQQYSYGDIVQDGPNGLDTLNIYTCVNANVSGVWATDLAAGDWALSVNLVPIIAYMTTAVNAAATATGAAGTATSEAGIATTQAGIATSEAGIATTQAGIATAQAVIATNEAAIATAAATGFSGTSTTSNTIQPGTLNFTIQANKLFQGGEWVTGASTASPTNSVTGVVASYNATTGALSLTVPTSGVNGSGTFSNWTFSVSGPPGPAGPGALTGFVYDFAGTSAPAGFLACDGTAYSRTAYAALFAAIGTTWGVGDGSTTFNVPNLARTTTVGAGGTGTGTLGNAVGNTGGSETQGLSTANLPAFSLTYTAIVPGGTNIQGYENSLGWQQTSTATSSIGSNTPHNNMQPSAVMLKCIKT